MKAFIVRTLAAAVVVGFLTGCQTTQQPATVAAPPASLKDPAEDARVSEQTVAAVLWYQRAAECRALYYQACNIARERIDQYLRNRRNTALLNTRRPAIIVDIDETVLDNSKDSARHVLNGTVFTTNSWAEWVRAEQATVLPGISNLFRYCTNNKVEIFYISNRDHYDNGMAHTLSNLVSQGLPFADTNHVFLKTNSSAKDDRRGPILTNGVYDVILLMGDNLADFHHQYDAKLGEDQARKDAADRDRDLFGTRYIVLPNPMYGSWEGVFYEKNATNKSSVRRNQLRP